MTIQQAFGLAVEHHQAGRLREAENLYRQILSYQPRHAEALYMLGMLAGQLGRNEVAVDLLGQAIAVRPNSADAHSDLSAALLALCQSDAAVSAARRAIALDPNLAEAYGNLGNALSQGAQLSDAIVAYRQAIALNPDLPQAHSNLGTVLRATGRLDEALAECSKAVALNGKLPEVHNNLANILKDLGRWDEAVAACRQAIGVEPQLAEAHFNLSLLLLMQGDFSRGWLEHEWRWRCPNFPSARCDFAQRQWDGSELAGRRILLHAEQGFGDTIQFVRYAPLVAARGGQVILACPPELHRLLNDLSGITGAIAFDAPLPPFDVHCPLLSLPLAFGTTLPSVPRAVPYLHGHAAELARWQRELAGDRHFKVGLVWAGKSTHANDRNRSLPLSALAPLARISGVSFYSLQKGAAAEQAKTPPAGMTLIDHTNELHDFADTAGLIAQLDLIISVDTAVVHLAGALGKPVWTLLPFVADWRWLLERSDSPWYPTMRLFRQPAVGDWSNVVEQVSVALADMAW